MSKTAFDEIYEGAIRTKPVRLKAFFKELMTVLS
jgi:hypothetical protein